MYRKQCVKEQGQDGLYAMHSGISGYRNPNNVYMCVWVSGGLLGWWLGVLSLSGSQENFYVVCGAIRVLF